MNGELGTGTKRVVELQRPSVQNVVEAIRLWEPHIDAWSHVSDARLSDPPAAEHPGLLAGACFAVKDVIDVAGMPTRFGSRLFATAPPAPVEAPIVAALRAAGGVPVGKTRTTEFAFVDPTTTRNPYDLGRSPGGSSSGSGAAVGARVVPFALGTQTAGSLCRPASYCGALSYKPGIDRFPTTGMAPLSPSFDAVGVIAGSMDWLQRVFEVLDTAFADLDAVALPSERRSIPESLRIGLVVPSEQTPEPEMVAAMARTVDLFRRQGHVVHAVAPPVDFAALIAWHRTVMLREAVDAVGSIVAGGEERIGPKLAAGLRTGRAIPDGARVEAASRIAEARAAFWHAATDFDLLLAYPVPGAAPVGLATTGDQNYLTPWTALGGPLVSLFAGMTGDGMPLGLLLGAAPGRDRDLMEMAGRLNGAMPRPPVPGLPGAA
ncbi:MAG: amidase [Thalassobaculaceae bacterium]|nr:amidase [Thalassobaculaceae bacterium]